MVIPFPDFLNPEELAAFVPYNINESKRNGPDSLKYKALSDTVKKKTDRWWAKSIVSEWIGGFTRLTAGKAVKKYHLNL